MSNEKQETIADIVGDIRAQNQGLPEGSYALSPLVCDLLSLADRIEAAAKREREVGAEAAQICGEVGEMIGREAACKEKVTDCNRLGNAAKMREALRGLLEIVCVDCKSSYEIDGKCVKCPRVVAAKAALSAPPRNCDRFATLDDARNTFYADYVPDETCSSATAFAIWLFDKAKGGAK